MGMLPSYAHLVNLPLLEEIYKKYQAEPTSVDSSWRYFFEGMECGLKATPPPSQDSADLRIYLLLHAYRRFGHLMATCNPIAARPPEEPWELRLETLGFKPEELTTSFPTCGFLKETHAPLQTILDALKKTYSGTIGIEYIGSLEPKIEAWIQERIEPYFPLNLSPEEKRRIMHDLNRAEIFEAFIHTKYVGQKRFSLEGGETLIPMLIEMIDRGAEKGVEEVVLGMAHRGRLNVLANLLNKSYATIFHEFEDFYSPELTEGTGDVKYHKGFEGGLKTSFGKEVKVTLVANPSHLEAVDPVVMGQARAKQECKRSPHIVPILIHGDAAIAGQGVVYETLQLSNLTGYKTSGSIHIVINNQIGFTTLPKDGRSTRYCTDIARTFGAPVFHVNAEDPEGCVAVASLALQIRETFHCDVFIDLGCYRKYGHNEGDEPTFTQPVEYQIIKSKKSIRHLYQEKLIQEKILSQEEAQNLERAFKEDLEKEKEGIKALATAPKTSLEEIPKGELFPHVQTAVPFEKLKTLTERFCTPPPGFHLHPKVQKLLQERAHMLEGRIDWGMAEHLAYASLLVDGVHVRLSGQDSRRGTFSHRHALLVDIENAQKYFPLAHLQEGQAPFDVFNSPLSEFAILGFEFGYSLFYPKSLVLWEAQYGDFSNGAQVIIDQFIVTCEQKWMHKSNIVLLLPHGYEGQGPEHSSGRMERFLQLAGEENIRVANCSTPAQFFHLLRAQALNEKKKPLIVFAPKALLRHPACVSLPQEFSKGKFEEVLDDPAPLQERVRKLLFCSGKIFYELSAEREKRKVKDIAVVRLELLYPFHTEKVKEILSKYSGFSVCGWVQEEHRNMGAYEFIRPLIEELLQGKVPLTYIGRGRSASPAAGSHTLHKKQHDALIEEVFS